MIKVILGEISTSSVRSVVIDFLLLSRGYVVISDEDEPEEKWSEWKDERSVDEWVYY
jgi:hypothetical protein